MEELLKFIEEHKFHLYKDGRWYTSNILSKYRGMNKVIYYKHEELIQLFINQK